MAILAIKGHSTRGSEVIALLETLGGKNNKCLNGITTGLYYFIESNEIWSCEKAPINCVIFTLEEFEAKFPYKVGDKVLVYDFESEVRINSMKWDGYEIQYEVFTDETEWYSAEELNECNEPHKEQETMEQPKEMLIGIIKDKNGDWELSTHKNYEIKEVDGKYKLIKKKPKYPSSYEECCAVLSYNERLKVYPPFKNDIDEYSIKLFEQLDNLRKLKICRDAYLKIAGDWKSDWLNVEQDKYVLFTYNNAICSKRHVLGHNILAFPTEEMRDAFYENFKDLIEQCKEFL